MGGPEKPFACHEEDCGESFTNGDRLAVHTKKHLMVLQLGPKAGVDVADQTPTPTRFIRNCEEVGLFQELQVNPFDDTFKRAMENRNAPSLHSMQTSLQVGAADDTLHTPHIFPYMPEDNTATLYSSSSPHPDMNLNRMSSEESCNQLSVVKCMSSSVEDNLTSIGLEGRKLNIPIKKRIDSKLKLTRQHSIDLPDDSHSMNIVPHLEENFNKCDYLPLNKKSELKQLQIPTISVSESSESISGIMECANDLDGKMVSSDDSFHKSGPLHLPKQPSCDSLKESLKHNFSKLISQKSIDMELINFTNEIHHKNMDYNISIEDLPKEDSDLNSVIKECVISLEESDTIADDIISKGQQSEVQPKIGFKRRSFKFKKLSCGENFSNDAHTLTDSTFIEKNNPPMRGNNFEKSETLADKDIPSICSLSGEPSGESKDKGYELLLKWPDGKKVYLKEVFRENESEQNNKEELSSIENSKEIQICHEESTLVNEIAPEEVNRLKEVNRQNLKRKLQEVVKSNVLKYSKNDKSVMLIQHGLVLPNNCVIVPQINGSTVQRDSIINKQILATNSPQYLTTPAIKNIAPMPILKSTASNVIKHTQETVSPIPVIIGNNIDPGNTNEMFKLPISQNPAPWTKVNELQNELLKKKYLLNIESEERGLGKTYVQRFPNEINPELTKERCKMNKPRNELTVKKPGQKNAPQDFQERNKAAVMRYRTRKKIMNEKVMKRNEFLEKLNKKLHLDLELAMQEIQRLRDVLGAHADCSVTQSAASCNGTQKKTDMQ